MTKKQKPYLFHSIILILIIIFSAYTTEKIENKQDQIVSKEENIVKLDATTETKEISAQVTRIIDGDTIEVVINNEVKIVRYIGIDTPETIHPNQPEECFGQEATLRNRELVEKKNVKLVKDISETDKYGRLLRYVYVDNTFVNLTLVQEGYANSHSYPPDIAHEISFIAAEQEARTREKGLWGSDCVQNS